MKQFDIRDRGGRVASQGFVGSQPRVLVVVAAIVGCVGATASSAVVHVDDSAPAGGNGQTWATAYRFVSEALTFAAVPANNVTEIRVGQGTYRPDQSPANPGGSNDRAATFAPVSNVALRGGYAGFGAGNPDLRDVTAFPTILTGNIGALGSSGDNSYNVVRAAASIVGATIDGFTIRDGNADGGGAPDYQRFGGGVHLPGGSLTLTSCALIDNRAINGGGGALAWGALTVQSCTFTGNTSPDNTGGAVIVSAGGSATFTGSTFATNSARFAGGAVAVWQRPASFSGCTFQGNSTTGPAGGTFGDTTGGAIWAKAAAVTFSGVPPVFTSNTSANGAAVAFEGMSVAMTGATFDGNIASNLGGAILTQTAAVTCTTCTFHANTATQRGGAVYLGDTGTSTFNDCSFTSNVAGHFGGGVYSAPPSIVNCTDCMFVGNVANGANQFEGGGAASVDKGTFDGCTFDGNHAERDGGGMRCGDTTVRDCSFTGNSAVYSGGGLWSTKDLVLVDCVLESNQAFWGGGLAVRGSGGTGGPTNKPWVTRCTLRANTALGFGGAIHLSNVAKGLFAQCRLLGNSAVQRGGGVMRESNGTSRFVSSQIAGNTAQRGAGAAVLDNGSTIQFINVAMVGNTATIAGGGLHAETALFGVSNSILWNNSDPSGSGQSAQANGPSNFLSFDHSCVQGWTGSLGGVGNFGADPLLVDADGADNTFGTLDDDASVGAGSPCLDVGSVAALPADESDLDGDADVVEASPLDLLGAPRIVNFVVDIGAAERVEVLGPGVYVGPSGGSWFTASNWAGNAVPGANTDVLIQTLVAVDQPGAVADAVQVARGGSLAIGGGSLTADSMSVATGGSLALAENASLAIATIDIDAGASLNWTAGTIAVDGGTFQITSPLTVGCAGDATLALLDGATVIAPSVAICATGVLRGVGDVACTVSNAGRVTPGNSPGTLTIEGDYSQGPSGRLEIEIATYASGAAADLLLVGGTATLDGTLETSVIDPSSPTVASFDVVAAEAIVGAFAGFELDDPAGAFVAGFQQSAQHISVGATAPGPRVHVRHGAAPGGAGQGWSDAFDDLQTALVAARLADGAIDEVWVAAGTYVPTEIVNPGAQEVPRAATFLLASNLAMYGGFAGNETLLSQRDPIANPTILSGDRLGNDGPGFINRADNVFHVVSALEVDSTGLLDGFTLRGGQSDSGTVISSLWGGGLRIVDASPTIVGCTLEENFGLESGGAVHIDGGLPTFASCTFVDNATASLDSQPFDGHGGAVIVVQGGAGFVGCAFSGNVAKRGAGIRLGQRTSASLAQCLFDGNHAVLGGTGISSDDATIVLLETEFTGNGPVDRGAGGQGGGIDLFRGVATIDSCAFEGNDAGFGGAMALREMGIATTVTGCTFSGNSASAGGDGGALNLAATDAIFQSCDFLGNVADGDGGAATIAGDPIGLGPAFVECLFAGNIAASGHGGAVALLDAGNPSIDFGVRFIDTDLSNNICGARGGAVYVDAQTATFLGGTVQGNVAGRKDDPGAGVFSRAGVLRGNGATFVDDTVSSRGQLRLGALPGGDPVGHMVAGGSLEIEAESATAMPLTVIDLVDDGGRVAFDAIEVPGSTAVLAGALIVSIESPVPARPGDRYEFISGGAISGGFGIALLPSIGEGLLLTLVQDASAVALEVVTDDAAIGFVAPSIDGVPGVPTAATSADFDLDGDLDMAVALVPAAGGGNGFIVMLRNEGVDGNGDWLGLTVLPSIFFVGVNPSALVAAPLDGDAYLDLAVANKDSASVSVLRNGATTGFTFATATSHPVGSSPVAIVAANVAGGGALDLIVPCVGTASLHVLVNSGAAAFSAGAVVPTVGDPRDAAMADLDGDTVAELVVVGDGGNDPAAVAVHELVGGVGAAALTAGPDNPIGLAIGDVDDDGWVDLVIASDATIGVGIDDPLFLGGLAVMRNERGTLSLPATAPIGDHPTRPALFDADGDGDLDVATLAALEKNQSLLRVARTGVTGTTIAFGPLNDLSPPGRGRVVVAADLDGNGAIDLVVASDASDGVASGVGTPTVAAYLNATVPMVLGDLDGDGDVDGGDLGILLGAWGDLGGPADLDGSGAVDGGDLGLMLGAWS